MMCISIVLILKHNIELFYIYKLKKLNDKKVEKKME